jgi:hypothetical protein
MENPEVFPNEYHRQEDKVILKRLSGVGDKIVILLILYVKSVVDISTPNNSNSPSMLSKGINTANTLLWHF